MLSMFNLDGKVAVVTGANKGLGQGMAVALAEAGADIVAVSRGAAEETGAKVEALGRRFHAVSADLTDGSCADDVIAEAIDALGAVNILVNNAGTIRRHPAIDFSAKDWDDVMGLNLRTPFMLSQAAARFMVDNGGGKIINTVSMLSYQGGITVPSYTASKSGLLGLIRALCNEWAAKGINVNGIAPGYMATDNTQALQADPVRNQQILDRIPTGRWGSPEDLGGAAVYLASSASDYVNGTVIAVDGGWLAR
ncbi:2-dehydro-3-deoxy-D-gluconate 5-dehydrogenase KduD [Marinihelvus fidelis]|uniref:2-dehydro-3-deoxy-D-gluconate 5-dehydrogenase KduD n=1 Tax=Marinihelvus fidelis TaxID=2613842 RepID=A0A5N0TEF5_9GAMM|nr:2-dehydro-3-deoxy-D-gluconate 5-dehydrogenase KduD [Marinihelvus fidelis]KAA9131679.1 2-dehydro-3-deoxy-D-gluconate 5-dehydrogenase KduD [Marinihelvus fidelis]